MKTIESSPTDVKVVRRSGVLWRVWSNRMSATSASPPLKIFFSMPSPSLLALYECRDRRMLLVNHFQKTQ